MKEAKAARCHLNLYSDMNKSDTDEGRSFNVVILPWGSTGRIINPIHISYFNPTKYSPLTETHF